VQRQVRAAMNRIDDKLARVLHMAYFEQKSHLEIAQALGEPVEQIPGLIADGLRAFMRKPTPDC